LLRPTWRFKSRFKTTVALSCRPWIGPSSFISPQAQLLPDSKIYYLIKSSVLSSRRSGIASQEVSRSGLFALLKRVWKANFRDNRFPSNIHMLRMTSLPIWMPPRLVSSKELLGCNDSASLYTYLPVLMFKPTSTQKPTLVRNSGLVTDAMTMSSFSR
jgi:hypothetical protein